MHDTPRDVIDVGTAEAARLLGLSQATVLRRLRAGALRGELVSRPQGSEWRVFLHPDDVRVTSGEAPPVDDAVSPARQQTSADVSQAGELERFSALLDVHMRGYVEREAERDRQLQARSVRIGELQAMLAAAEAGRDQAYADRDAAVAQFQELTDLLEAVTLERDQLKVGWWRRLLGMTG